MRLLSRRHKPRGTGSLLRPASLNNWAAAIFRQLKWLFVRPYKVAPGTVLIFYGEPSPCKIIVEVVEDKPPLPYNPAELPDFYLERRHGPS